MATITDINNELERIEGAKEAIEGAIEERGIEIPEGSLLGDLPGLIRQIPGPVQADWNEDDTSAPDYIKNKPTIPGERVVQSSANIPSTFINEEKTSSEMAQLLGISDSDFLGLLSGAFLAIKFQDGLASVLESVESGTPIGLIFEAKRGYFLIIPTEYGYRITRFSNNPLYMERTTNKVTSISHSSNNTDYPTARAVYNAINPSVGSAQPSGGILPNVLYNLGILTGNVEIVFASPDDANVENEYKFVFDSGDTVPVISWPASITNWIGNCLTNGVPSYSANKHYEVSVEGAYGIIIEF